mmetsp:Transcript_3991/g.11085  ORF Transcript_3991/g.11085 Transcript_3991/m.11085 type:complete len:259 (+) Transcript_3991:922-1698(+)
MPSWQDLQNSCPKHAPMLRLPASRHSTRIATRAAQACCGLVWGSKRERQCLWHLNGVETRWAEPVPQTVHLPAYLHLANVSRNVVRAVCAACCTRMTHRLGWGCLGGPSNSNTPGATHSPATATEKGKSQLPCFGQPEPLCSGHPRTQRLHRPGSAHARALHTTACLETASGGRQVQPPPAVEHLRALSAVRLPAQVDRALAEFAADHLCPHFERTSRPVQAQGDPARSRPQHPERSLPGLQICSWLEPEDPRPKHSC